MAKVYHPDSSVTETTNQEEKERIHSDFQAINAAHEAALAAPPGWVPGGDGGGNQQGRGRGRRRRGTGGQGGTGDTWGEGGAGRAKKNSWNPEAWCVGGGGGVPPPPSLLLRHPLTFRSNAAHVNLVSECCRHHQPSSSLVLALALALVLVLVLVAFTPASSTSRHPRLRHVTQVQGDGF